MQRLILGASALRFCDTFLLILPFYTVMFAEKGLTPSQIGVVLASWSVTGLLLEAPCGVLADRFSRRGLLAVGQLVRAAGFLVWLAVPNFWGFLVGLMLWGLKSAAFNGCFEALVYDELKAIGREAEYARVMGRAQAARAAGMLTASLLAAPVAVHGYTPLLLLSCAASVLAVAAAMSLPGVPHRLLFLAAVQAAMQSTADYWPLFGQQVGLGKPQIALLMAALGATGAVAATLAHRIRHLPAGALYLLVVATGGALAAAAVTFQTGSIALLIGFVGLYWLVDVNADARLQHALRPETRATVGSMKGFVMQAASSLLMLLFGLLAAHASYQAAFLAAGLLMALVGVVFGAVAWRRRPA
jgi:MFS family permease